MNMNKPIMALAAISTLSLASSAGAALVSVPSGNANPISGNVTWSASNEYILQGPVFVTGTLTIPAGTVVRGQPRNDTAGLLPGSLIVTRSGRIEADGNSNNPIIFTTAVQDANSNGVPDGSVNYYTRVSDAQIAANSAAFYDAAPKTAPRGCQNANGAANTALWGGVVICGNAPVNVGNADGLGMGVAYIEGFSVPNTNTIYGGCDPNDDSGFLKYVSIRYGGDQLADANEINGLTLGGVGACTVIDHVEVFCNYDDGIEVFGGTVNLKHCAVFCCGDDQFDFDQGYTGKCQFLFAVLPNFTIGSSNGDKLCEWDGEDYDETTSDVSLRRDPRLGTNGGPCPMSYPSIYNMTLIGTGSKAQIKMRHGYNGTLWNSIVVNSGTTNDPLDVESTGLAGYTPANFAASKLLAIRYTTFDDVPTSFPAAVSPEADALDDDNNRVNGYDSNFFNPGDFTLVAEGPGCCGNPIDPRPTCSNSNPIWLVAALPGCCFFENVPYRGAFNPDEFENLWTTGWSVLNKLGVLSD